MTEWGNPKALAPGPGTPPTMDRVCGPGPVFSGYPILSLHQRNSYFFFLALYRLHYMSLAFQRYKESALCLSVFVVLVFYLHANISSFSAPVIMTRSNT